MCRCKEPLYTVVEPLQGRRRPTLDCDNLGVGLWEVDNRSDVVLFEIPILRLFMSILRSNI